MAQNPSRGWAASGYCPFHNPATGVKIYGNNIQSGVITSAHILDGTVVAADVKDGAITSAKIDTAAVTYIKIKAAFLSGTLVSGQTTRAIAHGLAVKPKSVIVVPILTLAQAISARVPTISLAAASAASTSNVYIVGSQAANASLKYAMYVQI